MPDLPSLAEAAEALCLAAVLVLPGLACTLLVGLRGIAAWGLGPPVSVTLVAVAGIVAPGVGLGWSVGVLLAGTVVAGALAAVVGRVLDSHLDRPRARSRPGRDPRNVTLGAVLGAGAGGVSLAIAMAASMGSLRGVPAQPDTSYHLNQVRHMLLTGDISSLHAGGFLSNRPTGFYPAAFHGVATTGAQLVDVQPVVAANLTALLAAALVWVGGCVLLARQAFGAHGSALVAAGLASASFTAMPFLIAGYGVLWPNLLGMAMVPALLGCVLSVAGVAEPDAVGRPRALLLLVVTAPGLFFAHPNSLATLGLLGYLVVVTVTFGWVARRRRARPRAAGLAVAALAAPPVLWVAAQSIHRVALVAQVHTDSPPDESLGRALSEALLNNPRLGAPLWVTSALVLVGVVAALRRPRRPWLVVTWLVTWLVFVGVAAVQDNLTQLVTGFWYNTPPRLAAITVVPGFLLVTLGLVEVSRFLHHLVSARRPAAYRRIGPVLLTAGLLAAYVVATVGDNLPQQRDRLRAYYAPKDPADALLTPGQQSALTRLATRIPADAVVADNPWRGTSLLYAFTGRRVLYPTPTSAGLSPAKALVAEQLDAIATRPDVCAAVREVQVGYVVTGGANFMPNRAGLSNYPGVDRVPGEPGFSPVAQSGPYTLWQITGC
jgi:hypothetical protein